MPKSDKVAQESVGTDSLYVLFFISHNSSDQQPSNAHVIGVTHPVCSLNAMSLFQAFIAHLAWVNLLWLFITQWEIPSYDYFSNSIISF